MIKILLIDHALDEPRSIRRLLPDLSRDQFKVDSVTDYRAIIQGLSQGDFDVCLIDSALGNGLKLFGHTRSVGCTMPVILTVSNNTDEVLAAMRNGVADCLIREELTPADLERSLCGVVSQARAFALQAQRESRYLAFFDHFDAIVFTCDLQGRFTSMNRAGEKLLGFSQDEPLTHNLFEMVATDYLTIARNMLQEAIDTQRLTIAELIMITKDGRGLLVEISAHPICRHGRTFELQAVADALPAAGYDLQSKSNSIKKNLAA